MTSDAIVLVSYFFVLSILGIYGWHRYYLVHEYRKHKHRVPGPPPDLTEYPVVTVQLVNTMGECWESVFAAPATKVDGTSFRDKY